MTDESRAAQRWARRKAKTYAQPTEPEPVALSELDPAAQLLSDYEDAIVAHVEHLCTTVNLNENGHTVHSRLLHAEVRRLRAEVLHLVDIALGQDPDRPETGPGLPDSAV